VFQGFEQLHHACFVLVRVSVAPEKLCKAVRRIAPAAGLPDELQICDLRRTAATEGACAGATPAEMMAVGVWANPASIRPDLVQTREQAAAFQAKRDAYRKLTV